MAEANGIYSDLRYLRCALKADREHLAAAPLTPRQYRQLENRIEEQEVRLKALNAQHRAYVAARKKSS